MAIKATLQERLAAARSKAELAYGEFCLENLESEFEMLMNLLLKDFRGLDKEQWLKDNLKAGEVYGGLVLGDQNFPDYHLILALHNTPRKMEWQVALKYVALKSCDLPSIRDMLVLAANCRSHFVTGNKYWTASGQEAQAHCVTFKESLIVQSDYKVMELSVVGIRKVYL